MVKKHEVIYIVIFEFTLIDHYSKNIKLSL